MGFEADELALVRTTLRHAIDTNPPDGAIGALIAEGWADLVDADPAAAISILAEEAGAARSAVAAVDLAVMWGAGIEPDGTTAVLHDGIALAGAATASRFVWLTTDAVVEAPAEALTLSAAGGFDPALGASRAAVADGAANVIGDEVAAERALAAGRRALASQMVGAAEQMLTETVAYVIERQQYGRPIGSFQAVKHRLADAKVATAAARVATATAWEHAGDDDATLAVAAKCLAGRAQTSASTHCFQVHGGIAFTAEHGFQQWVRRGMLLDLLLGDQEHLTAELGRRLRAAGRVPRVPAFR